MQLSKIIPKTLKWISFLDCRILWKFSKLFHNSVTIKTKQGIYTLPMDGNDSISMSLYTRRSYELEWITEAMSLIRKLNKQPKGKGTIIDIGANNGIISIGMLVRAELDKAVAIEPEPQNFSLLKNNVKLNQLEKVITCLNYAVAESRSSLQFELTDSNYSDHRIRKSISEANQNELYNESKRKVINVEADTLENLISNLDRDFRDTISVIWIDIQGYEGYAFQGAKSLLSHGIPVVSEIWPYGLKRSGMSTEDFCSIAEDLWSAYWVKSRTGFIKYPIATLCDFIDRLGSRGDFDNVIFTR